MRIVISSGHGKLVRGAKGPSPWGLDEVNEARRVVEQVAKDLRANGVEVVTFHDDTSTTQSQNLSTIVDFHNKQKRDLDVSVHFNAYIPTDSWRGVECLHKTQADLAARVSDAIADASGLYNRGAKYRSDLKFLNSTKMPAILIETCFVDAQKDVELYNANFNKICKALADLAGKQTPSESQYQRPTLSSGKRGSEVVTIQQCLKLTPDGEYGPGTANAVTLYQESKRLSADGVCGQNTWAALENDFRLPVYPPPALRELDKSTMDEICNIALSSSIANYSWKDRGKAPKGYIKGMAFAYSVLYRKIMAGDEATKLMGKAATTDTARDVLAWYADQFKAQGMDNSRPGVDTLRHLFALQIGLGMRESSGKYCEGRDMSATNVSADTCEAGLFQMSWNANSCSTDVQKVYLEYTVYGPCQQTGLDLFSDGVTCSSSSWSNYGSGIGRDYQALAKNAPAFACESVAVALRHLRQHWGPINRKEVELKKEADQMLQDVESALVGV